MSEKKEKAAAILTIRDASKMTPKGRKEIARWIRRQTKFFLKNPNQLASRFTARYICEEDK